METTLVIGDAHAEPDQSLDRFTWLGKFIVDRRPDNIVSMGDFGTFDSISSYTLRSPGERELKRLKDDFGAVRIAMARMVGPLHDLQSRLCFNKKRRYTPRMVFLEGNHEDRLHTYCDSNPELRGMFDLKSMISTYGWEFIPYRGHAYVRLVGFTHVPMNGLNKPANRKHLTKEILSEYGCSIIHGHDHKLTVVSEGLMTHEGHVRLIGMSAGWFGQGIPGYATGSKGSRDWWSGVIMLHHINDYEFDIETISIDKLEQIYG